MEKLQQNTIFHKIPPGPKPPEEIYCLVEIPRGSTNKYEYDHHLGIIKLDRVLYSAVFFPTEYGIIPQTWGKDNDPLDVMVFSSFSTFPGCVLTCRPIGVLQIIDTGNQDNKIIAVPTKDPRFVKINNLSSIAPHFKKEIANFWENYSELQPDKKIKIIGWRNKEVALRIIQTAIKDYKKNFLTEIL